MNLKMKGLLKGLRYISHIFEPAEKEQEMKIGNPTDVKHVAHIGSDGPAANPPTWMNEYRSEASAPSSTRMHSSSSQDSQPSRRNRSVPDSPEASIPKGSRRNHGAARTGSADSSFKTNNGEPDAPRQNRRHSKSKGDQDAPKPSRRKRNSKGSPAQGGGSQ